MGICERKMLFEHWLGERRTIEDERSIARGSFLHRQWHRDSLIVHKDVQTSLPNARGFMVSEPCCEHTRETATMRRFVRKFITRLVRIALRIVQIMFALRNAR